VTCPPPRMVRGLHVTGRGLSLYVDGCPGQYRYAEQAISAAGAWEELRADMRLALVAYRRWVKSGFKDCRDYTNEECIECGLLDLVT